MAVTNQGMRGLASGVAIGASPWAPVTLEQYQGPFPFTGTLHSGTIDVSGDLIEDDEATMRAIMARQ